MRLMLAMDWLRPEYAATSGAQGSKLSQASDDEVKCTKNRQTSAGLCKQAISMDRIHRGRHAESRLARSKKRKVPDRGPGANRR